MARVTGISLWGQFGFFICMLVRGKVDVARYPMDLKVKNIFSATFPYVTCFNSCKMVIFIDDSILFNMQFFSAIMYKVNDVLTRMRVLVIEGSDYSLAVQANRG